ncbi:MULTISPECIES: carbohydrate ABC transporter permease [Aerococcus]|uniref:Carbohydrate ABC transporter permease n=1 Tax=Aerococcus urinaeequi TaxID=51665 RepID=A0AA47G9U8_9LACT|nr:MULTISPECIES: carbohydrate ABC transporter permease [Aerococcus]MCT1797963.1 carbohydrate ABC transporter permease [Aerococcus viridans]MEC1387048.1 carbohydrate ABC transporter permease [Aerococcus viridans]WAT25005.1 carbohydrate ABC transporter permease [Aerococcus urinaeequi]
MEHKQRIQKRKLSAGQIITFVLLTIGAFSMILPFFWMVSTSIKTTGETLAIPPVWLPENWQWSNYETALTMAPFDQYFINSVIITLSSTIGEVITSILAAFAFSKLQFFGKNILFTILISTMMVPFELLMIPNYLTLSKMGMINSYWAMIIPFLASVFSVFLLKQNFEAVPKQLYYAAKVDGASDWRFLWQILVPMSKSSIVTVVILKMIGSWNSFMWPLMVTNETHLRPLPVGLQAFTTEAGTYFELLMAAATIVVLPMIIIYLFLQKYIIKGISNTGVKG